jgi:hypothetical protein
MAEAEIGAARIRMEEAMRVYTRAKSDLLIAQEDYQRILDKWWREAIAHTTEKLERP